MSACKHPRVQTFTFTDGTPAPLWGCVDCAHKFVPVNLAMEKDAERYRWVLANWCSVPRNVLDGMIDSAMAAQKEPT